MEKNQDVAGKFYSQSQAQEPTTQPTPNAPEQTVPPTPSQPQTPPQQPQTPTTPSQPVEPAKPTQPVPADPNPPVNVPGTEPKVEPNPPSQAKAEEKKQDSTSPTDAPKTEQKAPEKYELKLPEGAALKAEDVKRIEDDARSQGLSNEQAQKLLESQNAAVASYIARVTTETQTIRTKWEKQLETDPEIGGAEYQKNIALAKRVVDKYGTQDFKDMLNHTGFGNHPGLVKLLHKIGKEMSEDELVSPNSATPRQKTVEEKFYGTVS